jgi:type IV secretion system protein VirB9
MKKIILIILTFLCATDTLAVVFPKVSFLDSRIQHVAYNPENVVEVHAYPGVSTQIVFASNEEVLDISSGFSNGWEFEPRRNNLYLKAKSLKGKNGEPSKPVAGQWDTDLHVTTNYRVYIFQLVLHPEEEDKQSLENKKIAYLIQFRYPAEEAAKAREAAQQHMAEKRLAKNTLPRNTNYSMQIAPGSSAIAPSAAYDDGRFTYLSFPGNHEFPAVFLVASDTSESVVNTHIDPTRPNVLVVQQVAPEMVLRLGKNVVGIFNDSYDALGVSNQNGTSVEGVRRTIKVNTG